MRKTVHFIITVALTISLVACGSPSNNQMQNSSSNISNESTSNSFLTENNDIPSASKGTKYTYLHDQWNLYIATMLSNTTIKIEQWGRFTSGEDGNPFEYEADICIIKTNDSSIDFQWFDKGHTAFSVKLHDPENSYWENESIVGSSIEDSNSEVLGANLSKTGANYTYLHDKWNLYKAIALSDTTIKIEQWGRFTAGEDGDPFEYEADICIIDTNSSDTDFEWLDDEHTSFIITMQDPENSYWEEPSIANFALE